MTEAEAREVDGLLMGLLIRLEQRLPTVPESALDQAAFIHNLIDAGERELAFEQVVDTLADYSVAIRNGERDELLALGARFGQERVDRASSCLAFCPVLS